MSAYVVMIRQRITNTTEMETYRQMAPKAREGYEITPLAAYGKIDVLEGAEVDAIAINRFETMEEARSWYNSSAYQEALPHRHQGADYSVFIVEGVDAAINN